MTGFVLAIHLVSTLFMTGVIWFVQIVHYPLFAQVGDAGFADYEADHTRLTGYVVMPPMVAELLSAAWLALTRPAGLPPAALWTGLALVVAIWLSTALLQVPQHARLASGFDPEAARTLVSTNWIRTLAWSARAALAVWLMSNRT